MTLTPTATGAKAAHFFETQSNFLVANAAQNASPYYLDHFDHSKLAISKTATQAPGSIAGKTALILGAGACHDLPLTQLADLFTKIVLLDVDTRYTKIAVAKLPRASQEKIQIEQVDLTGVFEEFIEGAEKIGDRKLPFPQFGSAIVDMLVSLNLKKKQSAFQQRKASFICSSLVCSQLAGGVVVYLEELSQKLYKKTFAVPEERSTEYDNWLVQLQKNHLKELSLLVEPEGIVYFADHFSVRGIVHLNSIFEKTVKVLGEGELPGVKEIQNYARKLFSIVDKKTWVWGVPVQTSIGVATSKKSDGTVITAPVNVLELREYQISSLSLQKKHKLEKKRPPTKSGPSFLSIT